MALLHKPEIEVRLCVQPGDGEKSWSAYVKNDDGPETPVVRFKVFEAEGYLDRYTVVFNKTVRQGGYFLPYLSLSYFGHTYHGEVVDGYWKAGSDDDVEIGFNDLPEACKTAVLAECREFSRMTWEAVCS